MLDSSFSRSPHATPRRVDHPGRSQGWSSRLAEKGEEETSLRSSSHHLMPEFLQKVGEKLPTNIEDTVVRLFRVCLPRQPHPRTFSAKVMFDKGISGDAHAGKNAMAEAPEGWFAAEPPGTPR